MSNVVNDRDNLLINAGSRINSSGVGVIVVPSSNAVKIATNGTATPSIVTFTATKLSVSGTITWSIVGGVLSGTAENVRTLNVTDMTADTATVTVKVTYGGVEHSNSATVHKVRDGVVAYTWIKYADSATGTGLSDDPTGKTYIGLAHNKSTATESAIASDYTWSLIKGIDGVAGAKGADGVTTYTWIKYADVADGTGLYDVPTNNTMYIGIATNKTTSTESTVKTDYVWSRFRGGDGVAGTNGSRGAGHYYTTGSVWSDAAAGNATPDGNVVDDVVTISNGTNFVMEKKWTGSAWVAMGTVIDGSLIVTNSITASKINANGLTLRDTNGNVILGAGSALSAAYAAPGTQNSDLDPLLSAAATKGSAINDDPAIENPAAWVVGAGIIRYTIGSTVAGSVGQNFFHASGAIRDKKVYTAKVFPIDANKVYDLSAVLYAGPGNDRDILVFIDFYDKDGDRIASNGWGSVQSHSGFAFRGLTPTGIWTRQGAKIGKGTSRIIPATARTALIGVWFQYGSTGTSSVEQDAQDIRLDDVAEAFAAAQAASAAQEAADAANAAIPSIQADINTKLSRTSASSLAATVTLATGGSILAGTTTNGAYHSPSGFYGVQGGVVKFSVPISGDPTFAGQLTAAYGTFGGLRIASGGHIASGNHNGAWAWPAANVGGGVTIRDQGILLGNINNPNIGFIYMDAANGRMSMPGFDYSGRQLTLTNPILIDPQMNTFGVTIVNTVGQYYWSASRNTNGAWAGAYVATADGQTGSEIYDWRVENFGGVSRGWLSTTTTKQVEFYVYGNGFVGEKDFQLICTVTRNGLSSNKIVAVTVNFT